MATAVFGDTGRIAPPIATCFKISGIVGQSQLPKTVWRLRFPRVTGAVGVAGVAGVAGVVGVAGVTGATGAVSVVGDDGVTGVVSVGDTFY